MKTHDKTSKHRVSQFRFRAASSTGKLLVSDSTISTRLTHPKRYVRYVRPLSLHLTYTFTDDLHRRLQSFAFNDFAGLPETGGVSHSHMRWMGCMKRWVRDVMVLREVAWTASWEVREYLRCYTSTSTLSASPQDLCIFLSLTHEKSPLLTTKPLHTNPPCFSPNPSS